MSSGEIKVDGQPFTTRSPGAAIKAGIGFVTEDRKDQGVVLPMTIRENISLASIEKVSRGGFIQRHTEAQEAEAGVKRLRVRTPSVEQKVGNLSGGNQQKVVIAKWLETPLKLLILDEPTRGIDVGAKREIYPILNELTAQGVAVLMISSELPEVLGMADRIIVIREGRIAGELPRAEATQEKVGRLALAGRSCRNSTATIIMFRSHPDHFTTQRGQMQMIRHTCKAGAALGAALAALTVALAGCHSGGTETGAGGGGPAGGGGGSALQIAVIPKGTSHEYWKSIHAGAIKAQQDLAKQTPPVNVNILWKGTESESDRNGQVNIIEGFVVQHVDGMVLAPLDNEALVTPVHDAVSRKIPVVIIDSSLNGTDWTSFVATNNEKGGELAGDQLGKLLNGKGHVLVLPYAQGSASTEDREKGFLTAIKKYPGITVLSDNQYGGPTTDTAYKTAQNLLARYGSQTDGVFSSNETNTRGMRLALKDANLLHKVKFVGFDAAADLVTALQAGEINALIVQNPFKMGETGVETAVAAIKGQPVVKNIDTGVAVVTTDNMNQPDMQQFLHPPIDQYLK